MNPRRLIPYAVVLLALVVTYVGLWRYQVQQQVREGKAKLVFHFKADEVRALTLKRPGEEVHLARHKGAWEITQPRKARADAEAVAATLHHLVNLMKVRDLGPGNLKTFGLDQPSLVVSFLAQGKQHRLDVGQSVPAAQGYYARKDDTPGIFIITSYSRDFLNQQLYAVWDRNLLVFKPDQVKSLKIRRAGTLVDLEKGDHTWSWVGRPQMRVSSPRLEQLLGELRGARVTEFLATPPADLQAAGLAPRPQMEVTLATPQGVESLWLGSKSPNGIYAQLGPQAAVVQVASDLPEHIQKALANLEDRRLWTGPIPEVGRMVWGPPGRTWTGVRQRNDWKLTGPNQAEVRQIPPLVEMALSNFQKLEYSRLLASFGAPAPGPPAFVLELFDRAGKSLFRLAELGNAGKGAAETTVRTVSGGNTLTALVPQKGFTGWQEEMARLTTPPPQGK